jgi:hypothetical protein
MIRRDPEAVANRIRQSQGKVICSSPDALPLSVVHRADGGMHSQ